MNPVQLWFNNYPTKPNCSLTYGSTDNKPLLMVRNTKIVKNKQTHNLFQKNSLLFGGNKLKDKAYGLALPSLSGSLNKPNTAWLLNARRKKLAYIWKVSLLSFCWSTCGRRLYTIHWNRIISFMSHIWVEASVLCSRRFNGNHGSMS